MTKSVRLFGLLLLLAAPAIAQDTTAPAATPPDTPAKVKRTYSTPKLELSGGFSERKFTDVDTHTLWMKGWYFSADYNFYRWLGGVAEVSDSFYDQHLLGDTHVSSILVGPQVYPFGHRKITVFGEFLVGAGLYRNSIPAFGDFAASEPTYAALMWQGGGGIDYNRWKHWGIRVAQVDFGHASFFPNYQYNHLTTRLSAGVVYRFGQK